MWMSVNIPEIYIKTLVSVNIPEIYMKTWMSVNIPEIWTKTWISVNYHISLILNQNFGDSEYTKSRKVPNHFIMSSSVYHCSF